MPNSLVKLSTISNVDSSVIGASDIFYYVHQAPGGPVSNSLKLSDLFKGTNNLTSDIKFNNNTLYIKSGKVGINKIPSVALDVLGVGNISGSFTVGGTSTLNGAVTLGSSLSVGTSIIVATTISSNGNINTSGSVIASVNGIFGGTLTMSSRTVDAFPAGTRLLFNQSTAPIGWTKVTTYDDFALRVVSGSVGTGGSVVFSSAFSSHTMSGTTDGHTLTIAEMPTHNHDITDPSHAHAFNVTQGIPSSAGPHSGGYNDMNQQTMTTLSTSVGVTGITINNQGGGAAHTHPFTSAAVNIAVKYVDVIICQKN